MKVTLISDWLCSQFFFSFLHQFRLIFHKKYSVNSMYDHIRNDWVTTIGNRIDLFFQDGGQPLQNTTTESSA